MCQTVISTGTFQPTLVARSPIAASPSSPAGAPGEVSASSSVTPATPAGGNGGARGSCGSSSSDDSALPVAAWGTTRLYEAGLRKQAERNKQPNDTREVWE